MKTRRNLRLLAATLAAAAVLAGCGGGGGTEPPRASINRVTVAGDSLADVGTFGFKFTVQNAADPVAGFPIFPQIVASDFGVTTQCNFFSISPATLTLTGTHAGCTNFAVGGAEILPASPNGPGSVPFQLATALQANGGAYTATDLVIVDGGGNDAAEAVSSYLAAAKGNAAPLQAFLARELDAATISAGLAQPNGAATLIGLYMQKLADTYYAAVKANTLDKGATHVAVLNMPDVTLTPKLQQVLTGVTASSGATAAAQLQGATQQWIGAFNAELAAKVAGDGRIALVPFYADLTDEITHPADFALTNVTTPACPVTGVDSTTGLPTYNFPTCTSAALDAAPPAGLSAGWWKSYAFSDSFHPTPYGHRLLAASVSRAIARAGWL